MASHHHCICAMCCVTCRCRFVHNSFLSLPTDASHTSMCVFVALYACLVHASLQCTNQSYVTLFIIVVHMDVKHQMICMMQSDVMPDTAAVVHHVQKSNGVGCNVMYSALWRATRACRRCRIERARMHRNFLLRGLYPTVALEPFVHVFRGCSAYVPMSSLCLSAVLG